MESYSIVIFVVYSGTIFMSSFPKMINIANINISFNSGKYLVGFVLFKKLPIPRNSHS